MASRLITQLPRLSLARAGSALHPLCLAGSSALLAPVTGVAGLPDYAKLPISTISSSTTPTNFQSSHASLSRGFAATAAEASQQEASPAPEQEPSQEPPGRSCGFQHQFEVVGAVEGPYDVTPAAKFAVVEVGSHQFKVVPGDVIITEKINGVDVNDKLSFSSVMMLGSAAETIVGRPIVPNAEVIAAVEEQFLDAKKMSFKKRRRKNSKRLKGNRQSLTSLRILEVNGIDEASPPVPSE